MLSSQDFHFIQFAFAQAQKGVGFVSPNPAVGAVIVQKGKIIGAGHTAPPPGAHAEVVALKNVQRNRDAIGATLYTTFEPCCHFGKTPPCTQAIIVSGIKEVVVGMKDPFHQVNGKGIQALRRAGIRVRLMEASSVLAKEIRNLNQSFLKWVKTGLPYVTLKAAVSLDGKIATKTGDSKWITATAAREDARLERSLADAVIVGAATVIVDNPELAPTGLYLKKKLLRVIIDGVLRCSPNAHVFRDNTALIATTEQASKQKIKVFEKKGISVVILGKRSVSIYRLLQKLIEYEIQHVFVEGGAGVHGAFCDAAQNNSAVIDRIVWYIAPKIIGGISALTAVAGDGVSTMEKVFYFSDTHFQFIGDDIKIIGLLQKY